MSEFTIIAVRQNVDAWYEECARRGLKFASAMLRNHCDAEEAVQESFLRLQSNGTCSNQSEYEGKYFRILRNHCIDILRRRRVRRELGDSVNLADQKIRSCNNPEWNETIAFVSQAIDQLPAGWREVLLLKVHAGLTYQQIAELTDFSTNQVRTWIYRSRRKIEHELAAKDLL